MQALDQVVHGEPEGATTGHSQSSALDLLVVGSGENAQCAVQIASQGDQRIAWAPGLEGEQGLARSAPASALVLPGRVQFVAPSAARIETTIWHFSRAILACEPTTIRPSMPGIEGVGYLTPESFPCRRTWEGRLAVLGSDRAACGWASRLAADGAEVHLLCDGNFLDDVDPEAAAIVGRHLRSQGVRLRSCCGSITAGTMGCRKAIVIDSDGQREKLLVDEILVVGPRVLSLADLGLKPAGISSTASAVLIDQTLRTSNPRVFVAGHLAGDATAEPGGGQRSAEIAVENAFRRRALRLLMRRFCPAAIPRRLQTRPAVVELGIGTRDLGDQKRDLDVYRVELKDERAEGCFLKVTLFRDDGRIAAVTIVAEEPAVFAGPLGLAIARNLPLDALAEIIPCSPGLAQLVQMAQRARWDRRTAGPAWRARIQATARRLWRSLSRTRLQWTESIQPPPKTRSPS